MKTKNICKLGVFTAALAAVPLLMTVGTAEARSGYGCTVSPQPTVVTGLDTSGYKLMSNKINVTCSAGRSVQIRQQVWEEDWDGWLFSDGDDLIADNLYNHSFVTASGSTVINSIRRVPNTEDSNEEMYQRVSFRVTSNGVTSPWTDWERTPYRSIAN
jgi:hypothetical protein